MTACRSFLGMTVSRHCEVRRTVAISDAQHYNERCAKGDNEKMYVKMSVLGMTLYWETDIIAVLSKFCSVSK